MWARQLTLAPSAAKTPVQASTPPPFPWQVDGSRPAGWGSIELCSAAHVQQSGNRAGSKVTALKADCGNQNSLEPLQHVVQPINATRPRFRMDELPAGDEIRELRRRHRENLAPQQGEGAGAICSGSWAPSPGPGSPVLAGGTGISRPLCVQSSSCCRASSGSNG